MNMDVLIQCQCTASRQWIDVAKFALCIQALDAAKALSALDGSRYRVVDPRWPDEDKPMVHIFQAGERED